ncbi:MULTISPECIES: Mrp/NBP35 family ATP-binding protein [unclassified Pseudodesulfovibrio]|uniref:Mrp/NBP35 family ATP-binding protein n=1 Tax=unclassified Pseudodesulfovibrio TaxID=2661612 RepID=UPI000FEBB135|nr:MULTISPECIES: Mrp/NBP35 family ATP-binding protein [unclassified Pseudodesulfovibrio]RWU02830.1 ATP-binding protein [Pseudodesulfovibrio sp. S3]
MSECNGCASAAPDGSCSSSTGCDNPDAKLQKTLGRIKHKIVVMSGKGGVGKSTMAANIAVALSLAGKKVGLLDVDVHGPSIPRLLALKGQQPHMGDQIMEPVPWSKNLSVMSLGFLLQDERQAVIWRGPVKMGLIKQFVEDVMWGDLDFLIVDCPPGTGDEPLSTLQTLGTTAMAVIVTTPQGVAIDDVRRSVSFVGEVGNRVFGIVENMSGFACPDCGAVHQIFNSGGGEALAKEAGVRFLGRIPLDPEVTHSGDEGYPFLKVHRDTATGKALEAVIAPLLTLPDPPKA